MAGSVGAWRRVAVRDRFDGVILDIRRVECESDAGKHGVFTLVGARDWAIAVALTMIDGIEHCVMVRQYRHGAAGFFLEFPGGVVEAGEDPQAGVARELEEETGYRPGRLVHAGTVSPNPAFLENRFHVFVALDCQLGGMVNLDEHEEVDLVIVPFNELHERMGRGELANAMMVTGLFLAERALALR